MTIDASAHLTARGEPYTAEELRQWRFNLRISQTGLGRILGVSQRTVSKWEAGGTPADFSQRFEEALIRFYSKLEK